MPVYYRTAICAICTGCLQQGGTGADGVNFAAASGIKRNQAGGTNENTID